jgi:ectoine hydroxylase-related dioxygenase (phytanoyl-CoA dioxygenase family)
VSEEFAERGWVVVRQVVPAETVAALTRALDEIYARSPPAPRGAVWELPSISRMAEVIAAHARDRRIGRLAAEALGCGDVQLLQDTVLVKPGGGGGEVAWHQDHTYTGFLEPARAASVRLALTPCTVASGCMEVIDGSHRWGAITEVRALTEASVEDALGKRAEEWRDRVVRIELEPGDVSIHHCLTLHRSGENQTDAARKTLITRVFDAECRLRAERLPAGYGGYFPTDGEGRLERGSFPVVS